MTHAKITQLTLCSELIGQKLGTNQHGKAGRALENLLERMGCPINRGSGPDILVFGLEVKSRGDDATSAQTIATMNIRDIIRCDYDHSQIKPKFQQQLRVKIDQEVIVDAGIYDFSDRGIQSMIRDAYEHARRQLAYCYRHRHQIDRTLFQGYWGFFERCNKNSAPNSYSFRLTNGDMETLESMALSNFNRVFDYD